MTQQEIKALYENLYVRGLIKDLHQEIKCLRPKTSRRTIIASFNIAVYAKGTPLQRRVIDKAAKMLEALQTEAA
jgi:hypothetical protein